MSDIDKQILVEFLTEQFEQFKQFLSENNIDENEAENIIDNIKFC